jgi:hypothetical protein
MRTTRTLCHLKAADKARRAVPATGPACGEIAKAKGRLGGRRPKFKPNQANRLLELNGSATYTQAGLAALFDPR